MQSHIVKKSQTVITSKFRASTLTCSTCDLGWKEGEVYHGRHPLSAITSHQIRQTHSVHVAWTTPQSPGMPRLVIRAPHVPPPGTHVAPYGWLGFHCLAHVQVVQGGRFSCIVQPHLPWIMVGRICQGLGA